MDKRALIDSRIKTLLTTTDLTFKQIIEQLKNENMPASFNTIRRVNRNHRYRKPRYDAKLTPQQRKQLIVQLKNTTKPNLSALARQFGVCHGSIWYWWDKLSKIREKNNGFIPENEPSLEFDELAEHELMTVGSGRGQSSDVDFLACNIDMDPLDLDLDEEAEAEYEDDDDNISTLENNAACQRLNLDELEMVGPVHARDIRGEFVRLPIIMYAAGSGSSVQNIWNTARRSLSITMSSSTSSGTTTTKHSGQTSSLSKRLAAN